MPQPRGDTCVLVNIGQRAYSRRRIAHPHSDFKAGSVLGVRRGNINRLFLAVARKHNLKFFAVVTSPKPTTTTPSVNSFTPNALPLGTRLCLSMVDTLTVLSGITSKRQSLPLYEPPAVADASDT